MRFCARWWLTLSDPALVTGIDIPETWGIMAPPSGRRTRTMTVLRPAPALHPIDTAPAWRRILTRQLNTAEGHRHSTDWSLTQRDREIEALKKTIEDLRQSGLSRESTWAKRATEVIAALNERMRTSYLYQDAPAGIVADAIINHLLVEKETAAAHRELRQMMQKVRQITAPFASIETHLAGISASAAPDA